MDPMEEVFVPDYTRAKAKNAKSSYQGISQKLPHKQE
jgi:hypothetical protein